MAGSGRGPLEEDLLSRHLASGLLVLRHCGGTGRDFRLSVVVEPGAGAEGVIRIEVTDACADRPLPARRGNGLTVVEALASRWGSVINDPVTKTVWAELDRCRSPHPC